MRLKLGTAAASRPYLGFRSLSFGEDVVEGACGGYIAGGSEGPVEGQIDCEAVGEAG